ncbi:hypothetical protein BJX99DRAFT_257970 [Aspergillus californicus]
MVNQPSSLDLDPSHTSCIGGRTVLTCRNCAGNAPRSLQWSRLQHLYMRTLQPRRGNQRAHIGGNISFINPSITEPELVDVRLIVQ